MTAAGETTVRRLNWGCGKHTIPGWINSDAAHWPGVDGLAIAVVLLIVGLWLAHELSATSKMQDCLMSGRTNCNVIPTR